MDSAKHFSKIQDALKRWPAPGSGNHSALSLRHDSQLKDLYQAIVSLKSALDEMTLENIALRDQLKKLEDGQKEGLLAATGGNTVTTFAQALSNSNPEAISVITAIVDREEIEKRKRESNLVITNMDEKPDMPEHDEQTVRKVLDEIGIEGSVFKSVKRLGVVKPSVDGQKSRPRPLLLQVNSKTARDEILAKSKQLRNSEFRDVYLKPDLTSNQLSALRKLREERDARNASLPNNDGPGRHFDVHDGGKWFWGIRNLELCRIDVTTKRLVKLPPA